MRNITETYISSLLERRKILRFPLIILIAVILLSWLYYKSEAVSPLEHIKYSNLFRIILDENVKINTEILAARLELSRNYDSITTHTIKLEETIKQAAYIPSFLSDEDAKKLQVQLDLLKVAFEHKSQLTDLFKRQNAILRNSLAYFQTIADTTLEMDEISSIQEPLEHYIRHLLFYLRTPTQEAKQELVDIQKLLLSSTEQLSKYKEAQLLLRHGNVIVKYQPIVDQLIKDNLLLGIDKHFEALIQSYQQGYEHARSRAKFYRVLLYVVAILLTAYLAFVFFSLQRAQRSLAKAHLEVIDRYQAQKKAEQRLLLHDTAFSNSHEAIMITNHKGQIIEINPAFTRITGYEREDIIGENPRILSSGEQDEAFYKAMWESISRLGNWRGEIWNRSKTGEVYPEMLSINAVRDMNEQVTHYVAVFSDISHIKSQEQKLQRMAHFDALTNLPNRVLLLDRMHQAQLQSKRNNSSIAVCFLDLDGFKPVNDTYGHKMGDKLLIEISNRFENTLRGGDTVSRLGGDEFVFILPNLDKKDDCYVFLKRIMEVARQPYFIENNEISLSASIGVTFYPLDNTDADSLLRHADHAMYQAKQAGKNAFKIFDPEKDTLERSQNERIHEIAEALLNNEFVMYYQPKVNMRQGTVYGLEALIRWNHPDKGIVTPNDFLPIIVDHSLTVDLGYWVINTVLKQMAEWQQDHEDLIVSVNVSSLQLQQTDFVDNLKTILNLYPSVKPSNLELEVLETAALEDLATVSYVIDECKKIGVQFSIDDFGTGYSSLTYLKRLPAHTLKIDLSFVRDMTSDPESLAIVHGIMGLATAFQKSVIAEGVETVEHGRMLMQMDCSYAQGYGISKPLPAEKVLSWISHWKYPEQWKSIRHLVWYDSDYPLLAAEVEHKHWASVIVHSINQGVSIPHKYRCNHKQCLFGKWYYGPGKRRYQHIQPHFQTIGKSHLQAHQLASEIDSLVQQGDVKKAKTLVPQLLEKKNFITKHLGELNIHVAQEDKSLL